MTFNTSKDKIGKIIDAIKKEKEEKSVKITNSTPNTSTQPTNTPKR